MKKGKLYTVTPWNKQALVKAEPLPAKNLFDGENMPTQQMNNRYSGIGNYSGQQSTFGMNNTNFGAAGNPYTPGTTAFNHYNIQSVENSISNGSYFNRNKDAFVYRPQNYVKGIDFTTNYNDTSQRWDSIVNSAAEGIGGWKPNVDTSGIPTQETSMSENPGWSTNPYLKAGMSIASQVKTGDRRGIFDTLDPFHNWAGKKTSKAGQVLGDVGVALTSTGIPYAMLAGAALKIVGDFADLGWGYNIENEQEVKDNIAHLKNISIQDGDLDSIQQQYAQAGIADIDVGDVDNGWFTDKGTEEAEKLTNQQDYYKTYAEHMFTNAANNYKQDQLFNALKQWSLPGSRPNQTAYGGLLDMKDNNIFDMGGGFNDDMPITNFGFISDYLTTKRKQAEQKNVLGNMFAGAPNSMFAIGGDLQTNGSDWSTGLTHVDAGQSHEMNPYDGVQMGVDSQGVPNLVEEGEVIFNDYVYSQRITLDKDAKEKLHFPKKQDITYADAAKKLEREIKERPNDPISQAGFEAQMGDLAEEQERQKAEMEAAKAQEAFDSLSDEEKVALMQQAAQQEQVMQEQAMAEQAAAQQQPTPEEMAMMEQQAAQEQMMAQQAAPQGIPEEAMMGAYGGLINRFDLGGLAWVKKHHPEVKNPQAVAKALERMMQANGRKYVTGTSAKDGRTIWDFNRAWSKMKSGSSLSSMENSFNEWVKYGLPREEAFKLSHPYSYYKEFKSDVGAERKRDYDAAYKRLVKDYKAPSASPKPQIRTSVQQQDRTKIPTYTNSKGEKFHIGEDGKYYHSEKAALIANDKYRKSIPTYTNSRGELFYVGDNGSYYRNIDAAVSSNTKYRRAKAAQQQVPVEEAPTRSAYRPPVEEAAANAEPTVRQVVERDNTSTSAKVNSGTQTAKGASPSKGVNVGEWNIDKPWDKYGLPGAEQYILSQFADYDTLSDEDKKQRVLDTVNGLNSIQESYWNNVVPLIGRKRQEWNEGVGQHQKQYHQMTGNVGFRQTDDSGQLLLDTDLTKPTGYYTGDSPKGEWVDYRSGPQTEQRHFGATGDNVQNLVDTLRRVGIDFSPYQDWTIGSGDNARQLYRASLLDAADNGAASNTPVQNNNGVIPVREEDYTLTEDELEAAGKKLDAQAKSGQGYVVAPDNDDWDLKPIHKQDWMRYAGIFGPAVGLGMQALGIGKPDASGIMAAANAASGPAHLATPHVIGDYMRYKPIDRLFEGNRILAASRATDRNLMNTSGGNRGTAMAGLLANGYNTQIALGNADMQAENVNWGRYGQTKDFNRGTNQFNAQALNQNSQFNADALNRQRQYAAQMQMQAAAQKADMDAAWYNGIYGNVAGLFKGIGDVGRENAQHNTVADMIASGIFGTMKKQPIANGFVEVVPKRSSAAKGGKIKRKKNKRGLTF